MPAEPRPSARQVASRTDEDVACEAIAALAASHDCWFEFGDECEFAHLWRWQKEHKPDD